MNRRRIFTLTIISTIVLSMVLFACKTQIASSAVKDDPEVFLTPDYDDITFTKKIVHRNGSRVDDYNTYIDDSFSVEIIINNVGSEDISNVNFSSPENNLARIGYQNKLELTGAVNVTWSLFNSTDLVILTYAVVPKDVGTYVFGGSRLEYSNGTDTFELFTDPITFKVYRYDESVRADKTIIVEGQEYTQDDARVKFNGTTFKVKINVTNYFRTNPINVTIEENLIDQQDFDINETEILDQATLPKGPLDLGESYIYSYDVNTTESLGIFDFQYCNVTYEFTEGGGGDTIYSNNVTIEVYQPIYEGDDWTKKVPLLSVNKYFQYTDDRGVLTNATEVSFDNSTVKEILVIINITNSGIVTAENVRVREQTYNDWVFVISEIPEVWNVGNITQGESAILNYTILPLIFGTFKIEPTTITFDYQNQETLLRETNIKIYSNVLEYVYQAFIPDDVYTVEWWITIGISFAVVLLMVVPLIISFVFYSKRRRTQKGT